MSVFVTDPNYPQDLVTTPAVVAVAPDLLDSLPPFEQASVDILGVLRAVGMELQRLEQARQDLIANYFPATAEVLLHFFEQMLGLPVDSLDLTLSQRQSTVLAFMQGLKSQGTGLEWEQTITALVGTNWTYQEHDPADGSSPPAYTVLIKLPFSGTASPPAGLAGVPGAASSGVLSSGTYYYVVTATTPYGESLPDTPVSVVLASSSESVHLSWTANGAPTTGYNVYSGTSVPALNFIGSTTGTTFVDDGTASGGVQPPPTSDTSGSIQAGVALRLARQVTPAHLDVEVGYAAGFLIGISQIGIEPL